MAQHVSIPSVGESGGFIEAELGEELVVVRMRDPNGFVETLRFDREEFFQWVQTLGTALCN